MTAKTSAKPLRMYQSEVIPQADFIHGFPERHGGVSTGDRSSLNLGARWGDDLENVDENRRRVAVAAGFDIEELVVTKHVHGTNVWQVGAALPDPPEFDGLVTDRAGPVLGAFAADCIPMVFADPKASVCGAAHSGWRGTVFGVATNVVESMKQLGSLASDIRVALGPSIGVCCFEVGPEVVEPFVALLGNAPGLVVDGPHKKHVNLRLATRMILERAGVQGKWIDDSPPCTKCEPERFFSYRRDGSGGGIHMGFIGMTGEIR